MLKAPPLTVIKADVPPQICPVGKEFLERNGNPHFEDLLKKNDWINDTKFKNSTEIFQHISSVQYKHAFQRTAKGYVQRINNERKMEIIGKVPVLAIRLVIDHIVENEIQSPSSYDYLFDEEQIEDAGWTTTLKSLSLTHRAFTLEAQNAIRTSQVLSGPSLIEFAISPACGPWIKKLNVTSLDDKDEESQAGPQPIFSPRLESYTKLWDHIFMQTPALTTLIFHTAFKTDEQFVVFIRALGEFKNLEVLELTERSRHLPLDMDYDNLADFFVCISKLNKLKYLGLIANTTHKNLPTHLVPTLRKDLKKLAPPRSLKTLFLSDFSVHGSYLKWLVEERGDFYLENLHVSGDIGDPSALLGGLRRVIRLQLNKLRCSRIPEARIEMINELFASCRSIQSLYVATMDELYCLSSRLPRTLKVLELGVDERLWNVYGPRDITIMETALPWVIKYTWIKHDERATAAERRQKRYNFSLEMVIIHEGANACHYTQLEGICRNYDVRLEIAKTYELQRLPPFRFVN